MFKPATTRKFKMEFLFSFVLSLQILSRYISAVNSVDNSFDKFILKYNKTYTDHEEYQIRLQNFRRNIEKQRHLNSHSHHGGSAVFGVTKFSDLSHEEFKSLYLSDLKQADLQKREKWKTPKQKWGFLKLPLRVDWRDVNNKNYISPVKNQNKCGACWAFASVETVESMYSIKTGKKTPLLSVQEVIDCADGNDGCNGGTTCNAFQWMNSSKTPLVSENIYPLTDTSEYCTILPNGTKGIQVQNYTCEYLVKNEARMLWLLAYVGPLTVAVDATTWNNYMGGIIQYHCLTSENHAVQIVGYDISEDIPYYIVKNSWGTNFGINGYLHIKYGNNVCGIAQTVSTVTVL